MTPLTQNIELVPITLSEANTFIRQYHRHHQPVIGHKFSIGVSDGEKIVGVAIVGRPVNRHLDDGWTLEVNRTCTDGTKNVNSKLYGACCRVAFGLGYKKIITYTLQEEKGTSLKASNWKCIAKTAGGSWNCKARPRVDKHPTQQKIRWEKTSCNN